MSEPWLSGTLSHLHPGLAALLYSFEQAQHDLVRWTDGLTAAQIWERPRGLAPVGFQLRHIAGSIDRLFTYAEGGALTADQLAAMRTEMEPGASREELLAAIDAVVAGVGKRVRQLDPARLTEPRTVGRQQLPTTVLGLLVHIAEHTQRHLGQAITTAKLLREI